MSLICEELRQALSQVWLKSYIFTLKSIDKLRVLPLEVGQVIEVHEECLFFVSLQIGRAHV